MNIDDIRRELRTASGIPAEALRAAVRHADALASEIYAIADKFRQGIWLLPEDDKHLFFGLHVLAAAKHRDLEACVLGLLRHHDGDLDNLFADHASISLGQILCSVWNRPADDLFHMLETADLIEAGRETLFDLIASMTFTGQIPRETTAQFLERFERDSLADDDDDIWWSWEDTVTRLGLTALEPAVRRVWTKSVNSTARELDRAESLEALNAAAANPLDPAPFGGRHIVPITDPADALAWITRREEALARWRAEDDTKMRVSTDENDPAENICLTPEELGWLHGFVESAQVPDTTMPFEVLDGFLTALVIGPSTVPWSVYMKEIWGTENGEMTAWDSLEQANHFLKLLTKHWNAIAARRMAGGPITPWMEELRSELTRGMEWADGFEVGIGLRDREWENGFEHARLREAVFAVLDLNRRPGDADAKPLPPKQRAQILAKLPTLLQRISDFWKDPLSAVPVQQPIRSTKVGRNDPCPCGSGKKHKKCCGGVATVH